MRAIQVIEPRKIAMFDDAPTPKPAEGEVLVQCSHVALCGTNMGPYTGEGRWANIEFPNPIGWAGHENVGRIVESRCDGWEPGTLVLAQPEGYFGFAEYIISKPHGLARLPKDPPDVAALVVAQPLATVLRAMDRTGPVINQRCAVIGQGPMGLIFTHVLGRMGASQVIAVDLIPWRLQWARRFGATDVVDASKEDVVERVRELTGGEMVDFSVEAVGLPDSLTTAAMLPKRLGRLFIFGMPHYDTQPFPWFHTFQNETVVVSSLGPECYDYFQTAVDMVVSGRSDLGPMVTPRMPWEKAPEAFEMYAQPAKHEGSLKLTLEL
ncbi:MAG TPA: zinc-binding dehydrogenase [Thermoguttaceae bacterium]|nr:zinc-binding dehydrogenase [Thermoguttaceae bacterium]